MSKSAPNRRDLMPGGALTLAEAAWSRRTVAAPKAGPGGFSPERLAKIPLALQHSVDQGAEVGIVSLLWRHGQVARVNALGYRNREANLPMTRGTIFRIARPWGLVIDDMTRLGPMPYGSKGSFSWDSAKGTSWQADPVEDMIASYLVQDVIMGIPNTAVVPADRVRHGMAGFYAPVAGFCQLAYEAIEV